MGLVLGVPTYHVEITHRFVVRDVERTYDALSAARHLMQNKADHRVTQTDTEERASLAEADRSSVEIPDVRGLGVGLDRGASVDE